MRTVCWPGCGVLFLERVRRDKDGALRSGFVVNGQWSFKIVDDECRAYDGLRKVVNRWPKPETIFEVEVPDNMTGDYNIVIAWAEKRRKGTLCPAPSNARSSSSQN